MNQDELQLFFQQNLYYIIAAGVVIGFVLGFIPFLIGRKRGKPRLGLVALLSSTVVGGLSPVLALIVAAIFSIVILVQGSRGPSDDEPPPSPSAN